MKESIKEKGKLSQIGKKAILKEVGYQALAALTGFLMARGRIFGEFCPFGLAFSAAVPGEYLALSAVGCFLGYLVPGTVADTFRYMAALFAIVAIKALLAAMTKYASSPPISSVVAFLVTCATGLVSRVGDTEGSIYAAVEAVLSLAAAYFISRAFKISGRLTAGLRSEELSCLIITLSLALTGLMSLQLSGISLGKILSVTLILITARFGQASSGTVCGAVTGFFAAISGGGLASGITFSLAGLCSGIFSGFGKYAQVAVFIISGLAGSAVAEDPVFSAGLLVESLFGSALFLCVPKTAVQALGKIFSPPVRALSENHMKKAVTRRLKLASSALGDVSETVDTVAKELAKINSPDFDWVLKGIETEACAGCSLRIACWEKSKNDTVSAVLDMIKTVREAEGSPEEGAPETFKGRCLRPAKVGDAVYKYYSDYASRMAAESRISDVRSVVTEQFDGISEMLNSMAEELSADETFDDTTAEKISEALTAIEINCLECGCGIDKNGRMTVELICRSVAGVRLNRMKLLRQVELCCDRDFDPPAITEAAGKMYITLTERAAFTTETGVCQLACSPSGISGDAYSFFADGRGRAYMVLSDGMGSGGRAAVDGAMASGLMTRLLKAGFGYESALSILNSAMLFKSTDESLATVDVACIDLLSGRTELLKAGAAPTVMLRGGKCGVARSNSLPAGILREIGFDRAAVKLRAGDILVMMSDGATSEGTDWICAELEKAEDMRAETLARHLAHCAQRRVSGGRPDDITVMVSIVEKAV